MNAQAALRIGIDLADLIVNSYLDDLSDADLLHRPGTGCNHINWQMGHVIASSNQHLAVIDPAAPVPLPAGFAERYASDKAAVDDPKHWCSREELLAIYRQQRAAVLRLLETLSESDLDRPTGIEYAPTVGALVSMQGGHWIMHAGQWAVIRRQLGRKPLF
jgi:hypothetical protein